MGVDQSIRQPFRASRMMTPRRLYSLNVFFQQGAGQELIEQLAQSEREALRQIFVDDGVGLLHDSERGGHVACRERRPRRSSQRPRRRQLGDLYQGNDAPLRLRVTLEPEADALPVQAHDALGDLGMQQRAGIGRAALSADLGGLLLRAVGIVGALESGNFPVSRQRLISLMDSNADS